MVFFRSPLLSTQLKKISEGEILLFKEKITMGALFNQSLSVNGKGGITLWEDSLSEAQ